MKSMTSMLAGQCMLVCFAMAAAFVLVALRSGIVTQGGRC